MTNFPLKKIKFKKSLDNRQNKKVFKTEATALYKVLEK